MTRSRLAVVAVGGNALIPDPAHPDVPSQFKAAEHSMRGVVAMIEDGWTVVLTHGNGPQVGFALRRSQIGPGEVPLLPMDYADADTQGVIGYMFQKAMDNEFRRHGVSRTAVTLVTQVVVAEDDPAMSDPRKPIGAFMSAEEARAVASRDGWAVAEDAGRGWRRVVPSPRPREIVELDAIRALVDEGQTVVACGGGGIPVVRALDGTLHGVWAVIDKDLTASLLARELKADLLLIPTVVDRVALGYGTPRQRWLDRIGVEELAVHLDAGEFAAGSMEPKVRAIVEYLRDGGTRAIVTDVGHMTEALAGRAGTTVER